jgi:hypothetical protein
MERIVAVTAVVIAVEATEAVAVADVAEAAEAAIKRFQLQADRYFCLHFFETNKNISVYL